MTPRGIRNHNPGNIRHSKTVWMGQAEEQADEAFVTFEQPVYGIRALFKILKTYRTKYGLKTIAQIIDRWAPPNENDTGAYVQAVAAACGVGPTEEVDLARIGENLVAAIIHHENGQQPYSATEIKRAIDLA